MAKPSGSICNIDCKYCFYLEKEKLYPQAGQNWRMSDETLELYVKQYIEAQDVPQVNFAWQGGEPTPCARQSCQQWPSHFSIMIMRHLLSISGGIAAEVPARCGTVSRAVASY